MKIPDIHTRCTSCQSVYAIKRIHDLVETPIAYCIYCGEDTIVTGDDDSNYWESLAQEAGLPAGEVSTTLIKSLFDIWTPMDGDPLRFIDFAKKLVVESRLSV